MPVQTTTLTNQMPPWLEDIHRRLAERSAAMSQTPYTPYPGRRVADYNPDFAQAVRMGRDVGIANPYFEEGARGLRAGLTGLGPNPYGEEAARGIRAGFQAFPENVNQYMSPYMNNVVNQIAQQGERTYRERFLPAIADQFISAGQPGSSRHQDLAARTARDVQENILAQQNQALAHGYESAAQRQAADRASAMGAGQQLANLGFAGREANAGDRAAAMGAGQQLANLGVTRQAAQERDIGRLAHQGLQQMAHEQQGLDVGYQNFLRQQQHPNQQLVQHAAIAQALPQPSQFARSATSINQTENPPEWNTAGNVGNMAGMLYGARMSGGFKKGGRAKSKKMQNRGLSNYKRCA